MNKVESTRLEKMNGEYDEKQKAHGIRQTLKPLWLEQDRKGMNKRISATVRLKMEGLEHELIMANKGMA